MNAMLQRHNAKFIYAVPDGLRELMSDISREVLSKYYFCMTNVNYNNVIGSSQSTNANLYFHCRLYGCPFNYKRKC